MNRKAKITSKGQVTVPHEIRRLLGVQEGDSLSFEADGSVVRVRPIRRGSCFIRYQGIGNPGIGSGEKAISRWLRELRGE
jgi:AbrB family looped-hinge helix DNA binding protein